MKSYSIFALLVLSFSNQVNATASELQCQAIREKSNFTMRRDDKMVSLDFSLVKRDGGWALSIHKDEVAKFDIYAEENITPEPVDDLFVIELSEGEISADLVSGQILDEPFYSGRPKVLTFSFKNTELEDENLKFMSVNYKIGAGGRLALRGEGDVHEYSLSCK